jgi:predicted transposase YbfD/YdcC
MPCILKKTLEAITKKQHEYIVQVKGNQQELLEWIRFNTSIKDANPIGRHISNNKEHGRCEERICSVYDDIYGIKKEWKSINSIIKIEATTKHSLSGKITKETRYYASSLSPYKTDAKTFNDIIRSHWSIENSLHHVRDVAFREDACRVRFNKLPVVFSLLRSFALNLLNLNGIEKKSRARKELAWGIRDVFGLKGV